MVLNPVRVVKSVMHQGATRWPRKLAQRTRFLYEFDGQEAVRLNHWSCLLSAIQCQALKANMKSINKEIKKLARRLGAWMILGTSGWSVGWMNHPRMENMAANGHTDVEIEEFYRTNASKVEAGGNIELHHPAFHKFIMPGCRRPS